MTTVLILAALAGVATVVMLWTGRASPNHGFVLDLVSRLAEEVTDDAAARTHHAA